MKRILGLACAAFAFGLLGSPAAAQDTAVPPAPPPPAAEQLPPPPPFPPMPSSRPSHRFVDMASHRSSSAHAKKSSAHKAGPVKHQARATKHRGRTHASKRASHKAKPLHFSKRTIRQCHGMTYKQIMRHSSCRTLMKQELSGSAGDQNTSRHKAASKHKRARHPSAVKRRRR